MDVNRRVFFMLLAIMPLLMTSVQASRDSASLPLPNLLDSPHIKNQSLVNCGGSPFSITVHPRKRECMKRKTAVIRITPKVDVLSVACYLKLFIDGVLVFEKSQFDLCSKGDDFHCPLIKGKTQRFEVDFFTYCSMPKGDYQLKEYCTNEEDVEIMCAKLSFTWV